MDDVCEDCGKTIGRRAKANVWNGDRVVCTPCLHERESQVLRHQNGVRMAGVAGSSWLVHDGQKQWGPYTTAEVIAYLKSGQIKWEWTIWREGLEQWKSVHALFTPPDLCEGRLELRDFCQGDGTYRPLTHHSS